MIPRRIFTIWLNPQPMPELLQRCVESQKLPGYEHRLVTLDNLESDSKYVYRAITARKWVKASDYLRVELLYKYGGIYLDADMEVVRGKNFDHLLGWKCFIPRDPMGHFGNAGFGSEAGNVLLKFYLERLDRNFVPEGNLTYDPGVRTFSDVIWLADKVGLLFLEPAVFFPYNHQTGRMDLTMQTLVIHHYSTTWGYENHATGKLIDLMVEKIERSQPFIFMKRGDGEMACMNGETGTNCDNHPYTKELGDRLRCSYDFLKDYAYIVDFHNQEVYNSIMFRTDVDLNEVLRFWKAVKACQRPKVYVGPARLHRVAELLGAKHVQIPEVNAYAAYDKILGDIIELCEDDMIIVFTAGMPAKVMMADLIRYNLTLTCIDAGSAFDPMLGQTRTNQVTPEKMKELVAQMEER